jgi:lipopolysaccharide export system permease protein
MEKIKCCLNNIRKVGLPFKIFDGYITKQVLSATLVCIFLFVVIWIAPETLLKVIKRTLAGDYTIFMALQLLAFEIPKIVGKALPVGLLLGTLFMFDKLTKDSELTVLRGIGLSFWRIVYPIVVLSIFVSVLCFSLYNTLIPYSEKKINYLKQEKYDTHFVYSVKEQDGDKLKKILIVPKYANDQITKPLVLNFDSTQYTDTSVLSSIMQAQYAVYSQGQWVIHHVKNYELGRDGVFKNISNVDSVKVLDGERADTAFKIMSYSTKRDRELNNTEITEYIGMLKSESLKDEYRFMLNKYLQRYFHSAICILFAVLGCLLGFSKPREQKLVNFVIGIGIVFAYYITLPFFDMCAEKGILSPIITSAIQPVAILIAIFVFKKIKDL